MKLHIKIILVFITAAVTNVFSQSVDSLIAEALVNNPQLKSFEQRIKSIEYRSVSVNNLPPPTAGIEFAQINVEESNIWDKALSQNFFISQMFPIGGKLSAMEDVEKENIRIAEREYEIYRNKLVSEIRSNYYQLWMFEHHAELKEEVLDLLRSLLESSEKAYIVNRVSYSDMLLLKSEIASNNTDITVLENQAEAFRIKLNSLTGREIDDGEINVFHNWETDTSEADINFYREALVENNPSLKRMDNMVNMSRLEMTANNKELIPDLMVQGMFMRMPQGMILTEGSSLHMLDGTAEVEYMYSLMASITLPFAPWSSGKFSSRNQELEAGIKGIEYEKLNMYREMTAELESAGKNLQSAKSKVKLLKNEVIPLYKEALSSRISEYQNNLSDLSAVIDNIRMYLMKEEELGEAMADHEMYLAEIREMTGELK